MGGKSHPVFVGTVVSVTDLPQKSEFEFLASRKARIRVDEPFGGLAADVEEIDVLTGAGGGDCGIPFQAGDVYLIDGSVGADGRIHAGICSNTRRVEFANMAVRILRQRRDGRQVPSVVGTIAQSDRNFEGFMGTHPARPLANTLVRVKALMDGAMFDTRSDTIGRYEFYGLPTGRYQFAPELPPGTIMAEYVGSDGPPIPFEVRVGECQERGISVFASGSIEGRVLDASNKLLAHAFVNILPSGKQALPKARELYWASQGKEGFFKFVHLPPGRYLLVVNPDDKQDPEFPYPRTFYPAVHDRDSAKVITLQGGEHSMIWISG